ncbi:MAG: hypothetical protein AAF226_10800, partial [Verrucomicrobiota bacterium]
MLKQIINQESASPSSSPASGGETSAPASPAPSAPASTGAPVAGKNILSSDVEIKGKLKFSQDLIV